MNCLFRRVPFLQAIALRTATTAAVFLGSALCIAGEMVYGPAAQAQTRIVPGATDTDINPDGLRRYNITGGELSAGNAPNLFHHFVQFRVGSGDRATFVVPGQVENVIGLIDTSGPVRINGVLGLTGADANLYLVSPGGVIFGAGARLALPADLFVTTADELRFGNRELSVEQSGTFDAAGLTGTPSAYVFTVLEPEAIENRGSLTVGTDQSITLLAGNVRNAGQLKAPSGTVHLAAVPGGHTVRLRRPGDLLSLDLTPNRANLPPYRPTPIGPSTFSTADFSMTAFPSALTGGEATEAGQMVQNPDGSYSLVGAAPLARSGGPNFNQVGTVLVQGDVDVSGNVGGEVAVVAPRVALIGADVIADGARAAGTIQIGSLNGRGGASSLDTVYIYADRATNVSASALGANGRAGRIYIWADDTVQYYGGAEVNGRGGTLSIDAGEDLQRIVPRTPSR